jgi:hypothetical protein
MHAVIRKFMCASSTVYSQKHGHGSNLYPRSGMICMYIEHGASDWVFYAIFRYLRHSGMSVWQCASFNIHQGMRCWVWRGDHHDGFLDIIRYSPIQIVNQLDDFDPWDNSCLWRRWASSRIFSCTHPSISKDIVHLKSRTKRVWRIKLLNRND